MFPQCTIESKTPLDQIKSPISCRPWISELGAFIIFVPFAEYLQRAARTERGCPWQGWEARGLEEKVPSRTWRAALISRGSASGVLLVGYPEHGHFYPRTLSRLPPTTHTPHSRQLQEPDEAKRTAFKITPGFRVQFKSHGWEPASHPANWGAGPLPMEGNWVQGKYSFFSIGALPRICGGLCP